MLLRIIFIPRRSFFRVPGTISIMIVVKLLDGDVDVERVL